eukprot:365372-Chlamydomonas_euryale.AAC.9
MTQCRVPILPQGAAFEYLKKYGPVEVRLLPTIAQCCNRCRASSLHLCTITLTLNQKSQGLCVGPIPNATDHAVLARHGRCCRDPMLAPHGWHPLLAPNGQRCQAVPPTLQHPSHKWRMSEDSLHTIGGLS